MLLVCGRRLFLAALAITNLKAALASIYPTQPIAKTVYPAGQFAFVTWIDDGQKPHLKDMGPIKLDLYVANSSYVATLASDVAATTRSHSVFIPPGLHSNVSRYTLRFTCADPPRTIFTADFNITVVDDPLPVGIEDPNAVRPIMTLVLPGTTLISQLAPTPTMVSSTTVHANPLGQGGEAIGTGSRSNSGTRASASKKVDLEKIKFRVVFILWPALIGISLAM